jgi:type IX secretion system PorP/SprF family membrane protein
MRRLLSAFAVSLVSSVIIAQQQPHYTQYAINNYILNPALTGIENYTDVKISHRQQWVGFTDAPVTTYFTIHTPLGKKDYRATATSFGLEGENPRGSSYWQNYESAQPHHGIGLKIINDKTGPINRFGGYISYAYHLGIGAKTSIAAGFEAGIRNISLNAAKLNFDPNLPVSVDPAVGSSKEINNVKPDFGAGIWVYSGKYFIGLAAQQIIPQTVYYSNNTVKNQTAKLVPHIFGTAGYRFFVNDVVSALPSIMVKYINTLPTQVDANIKFQYRDFLWLGAGYRFKDGVSGMAGINISNTFNISYSYDYTTSNLNRYSNGSHEIVLGFLLNNKYGDWCPRNVW